MKNKGSFGCSFFVRFAAHIKKDNPEGLSFKVMTGKGNQYFIFWVFSQASLMHS